MSALVKREAEMYIFIMTFFKHEECLLELFLTVAVACGSSEGALISLSAHLVIDVECLTVIRLRR